MVRKIGQIVRREPSTWLVCIYVGRDPETRKRKYVGKLVHSGLRSALAHLNRMLAERDLGRNIRSSRQTVGQYFDHWLDICARPRLRAKSFRDYSSLLARYVHPHLGSRSSGELSPAEIQKLYSELLNRKLSARTICYTHAVLFSALRQAVRWKLLPANPAEDVHLPRKPRRRFTVFDVGQPKQFIAAMSGHEHEALFPLALTTGMRLCEYLALTWTDFNLDRGTVSVSKTLEWRTGGWCFEDTKRERSRRLIKLQNWVVARLRNWRKSSSHSNASLEVWYSRRTEEVRFMKRSLSGGTSNQKGDQAVQRDGSVLAAKGVRNLADAGRRSGAAQSGTPRMGGLLRAVLSLEVSGCSGPLPHRILGVMGDAQI